MNLKRAADALRGHWDDAAPTAIPAAPSGKRPPRLTDTSLYELIVSELRLAQPESGATGDDPVSVHGLVQLLNRYPIQ